eukprot:COSAG01_NODE_1475_length_10189_cov_9.333399_3_plen_90_part_00
MLGSTAANSNNSKHTSPTSGGPSPWRQGHATHSTHRQVSVGGGLCVTDAETLRPAAISAALCGVLCGVIGGGTRARAHAHAHTHPHTYL